MREIATREIDGQKIKEVHERKKIKTYGGEILSHEERELIIDVRIMVAESHKL